MEELVLYEGVAAMKAHQDLFSFARSRYISMEGRIRESIVSASSWGEVIHISAGWELMLKAAFWSETMPAACDVLSMLERRGVSRGELAVLEGQDSYGLFQLLHSGNKLTALRHICRCAKERVEFELGEGAPVFHCQLVSDETGRIIASSL